MHGYWFYRLTKTFEECLSIFCVIYLRAKDLFKLKISSLTLKFSSKVMIIVQIFLWFIIIMFLNDFLITIFCMSFIYILVSWDPHFLCHLSNNLIFYYFYVCNYFASKLSTILKCPFNHIVLGRKCSFNVCKACDFMILSLFIAAITLPPPHPIFVLTSLTSFKICLEEEKTRFSLLFIV